MIEGKQMKERGWSPTGGCFAGGNDLPEMVEARMRAMKHVAEVMKHIPGTAFYPAGTICKLGRVPVTSHLRSVPLDGGDK